MLAAEQRPFGAAEAAEWQAALDLSNQEAADLLGVQPSTWSLYKAKGNIPTAVVLACRAARRDPFIMHAHFRPRKPERPRKQA